MEENNIKIEEVIETLKELKEENHRLEVENEELKDVFSKVLQLFNNDKERFFKAIKGEVIDTKNNKCYNVAGKEYNLIDLGLPSGTLWMDRNVGASSPEDAGLYFAWGETQGYTSDEVGKTKQFNWDDYKFGFTTSKYNTTDCLTKLETKDDSVLQNTHRFIMPSIQQMQELIDNTDSTCTTQNGVNGRLFTSKTNGNSIFVPATGYGYDGSVVSVGSDGYLWSSSWNEDDDDVAYALFFEFSGVHLFIDHRCVGFPARGVSNN